MHRRRIGIILPRPGSLIVALALLLGVVACGGPAATPADAPTRALGGAATATAPAAPTVASTPTAAPTVAPSPTLAPTPTATVAPSPSPTAIPPTASPTLTPRPSPTATRPVASPTPVGLRPAGTIPAGWKSYSGTAIPAAIAYPPGWTVEEGDDFVKFRAPGGTAILQIVIIDEITSAATAEQARDDFWAGIRDNACLAAQIQRKGNDRYSGISFAELLALCDTERGERALYVAAALGSVMTWGITATELADDFEESAVAFFDPMLGTLNLGVRRAGASPQPTATRAAAATPGTGLQPRAPIPAGWRTYVGTMVPFAISYPPDWRVDDANQVQGLVNFLAPDGLTTLQVRSAGTMTATLGVERLRELYIEELTKRCGLQAQAAGYNFFSGIRFASILVTPCTANGKSLDLYYGTGIRDGEEWTISFTAPQGRYVEYVRLYFGPLVDSLVIVAP